VPIFYDPMISKVAAWAEDRPLALARMRRALEEYLVTGIKTTLPFFRWLLAQPEFAEGRFHTAYLDGVHGDTNATFLAGDVSEEHRLLVERTHEATVRAITAVKPGRALSVVGRVIESYANRFGYNVVRDFTGHGIGTTFHNGLVVLHYDQPAVDTVIEPGMTFTIEPMINLGSLDYEIWDDGWTVATKDHKWTAQFEHTLVVTDDGAEILTLV